MSSDRFIIKDGAVEKVHVLTGGLIVRRPPRGTRVVQVLPKEGKLVVREDYYQFPEGSSNVYCLDQDLELLWTAELPSPTDVYANPVIDQGEVLECGSWAGFDCVFDPQTGRILRKAFTR